MAAFAIVLFSLVLKCAFVSTRDMQQKTSAQVRVSEGLLQGELVENYYGGQFYSFKGIPYAVPPIGNLRFKAPLPVQPWEGVRLAKDYASDCYQISEQGPIGSEDCLYLNVNTPDLNPATPLPVMVWIHGGGFQRGTSTDRIYGPEYLIRHGVLFVSLNYRVEILGFLSLGIADVPGNAGMKDQVLALRWIKNNIARFGGDPDNITIFGESAGGASVSYHLQSPMSKGLFKRAIAQSGASTCPWSFTNVPLEKAVTLVRKLGFTSRDPHEIFKFLKTQPLENIFKIFLPTTFADKSLGINVIHFAVVSEVQFPGQETFFHGDPADDLRNNGIPEGVNVMTGYAEHEGIYGLHLRGGLKHISNTISMSEFFVPEEIRFHCNTREQLDVGRWFRKFYTNDTIITGKNLKDNIDSLINYCTMADFAFGVTRWENIAASVTDNKIYFYKFTAKSALNIKTDSQGMRHLVGNRTMVSHGEDNMYLFVNKAVGHMDKDSKEFRMIDTITKLWTNFAKYGNPTPDSSLGTLWSPYTVDNQDYLDIGEKLIPGTKPENEEIELWESVYRQYLPSFL